MMGSLDEGASTGVVVCEDGRGEGGFANDDDPLRLGVLPNDGAPPKANGRGEVATEDAANEKGLKASEVEPSVGASPLNSNGMVKQCYALVLQTGYERMRCGLDKTSRCSKTVGGES